MKRVYKTSLSPLQQKRIYRMIILLVVLFLLFLVFMPGKGLFFLHRQKARIGTLNAEKQQLEETNTHLREEVKRLKTDAHYLEEVAREQHGLLKKNEKVFDFSPRESKKKE